MGIKGVFPAGNHKLRRNTETPQQAGRHTGPLQAEHALKVVVGCCLDGGEEQRQYRFLRRRSSPDFPSLHHPVEFSESAGLGNNVSRDQSGVSESYVEERELERRPGEKIRCYSSAATIAGTVLDFIISCCGTGIGGHHAEALHTLQEPT